MKFTGVLAVVLSLSVLTLLWCKKDNVAETPENEQAYQLNIPKGFPDPVIPDDNQLTAKRIALGKKLFFEKILSLDSSISCGSCHFQKFAFSDSVPISKGVHGANGLRNAPPLFNMAWQKDFFFDIGVPTLELQVISPIQTEEEMHINILEVVDRLRKHPEYPKLALEAYGREIDPFVITRAIASFERTLISGNSRFDQYHYQGNSNALNAQELRGLELFNSDRLKCNKCHSGFNFTSLEVVSNGLYDDYTKDPGRMRVTLDYADEGKFKVASLRNIELTGPYMHDGSMETLDEVIDNYASGGSDHKNKHEFITGFDITEDEKNDLIAFLHSLTDHEFVNNIEFNQ